MEETAGTKRDPLKRYISEISNYSLLTVEEEAKLAKQIHGKNEETRRRAMDVLIRSNLRLVVRIAHDFKGAGLPLADLISEGNLGLIRSGSTFNPELGAILRKAAGRIDSLCETCCVQIFGNSPDTAVLRCGKHQPHRVASDIDDCDFRFHSVTKAALSS